MGSTWYFAHLVAANAALLAVGVALRHDRERRTRRAAWDDDEEDGPQGDADPVDDPAPDGLAARLWAATWPLDGSQVLAGLLLGIAVTARLPMLFAAPFFVLVGGGETPPPPHRSRRRWAASSPWRPCWVTRS